MSYRLSEDLVGKAGPAVLDSCYRNHLRCEQRTIPCLPSRAIDIGPGELAIEPKLHIRKKDESVNYACFSYCWGGPQQSCITKATLESSLQGLKFNNLARTIQDAFKVTRMLKLRYLRVDALYIIRDDATDNVL